MRTAATSALLLSIVLSNVVSGQTLQETKGKRLTGAEIKAILPGTTSSGESGGSNWDVENREDGTMRGYLKQRRL